MRGVGRGRTARPDPGRREIRATVPAKQACDRGQRHDGGRPRRFSVDSRRMYTAGFSGGAMWESAETETPVNPVSASHSESIILPVSPWKHPFNAEYRITRSNHGGRHAGTDRMSSGLGIIRGCRGRPTMRRRAGTAESPFRLASHFAEPVAWSSDPPRRTCG